MQISVQAGDVKRVLSVFAKEYSASEKDQLDEESILKDLRKACSFIFCLDILLT